MQYGIVFHLIIVYNGHKTPSGKTLIFFDELQDFPEISTALKFFNIDGRFDVICSGSLLGIHYKRIESNSVGYKTDYEMCSLDFEEFLWAKGYDDEFVADMLDHMINLTPFNDVLMLVCMLSFVFEEIHLFLNVRIISLLYDEIILTKINCIIGKSQ